MKIPPLLSLLAPLFLVAGCQTPPAQLASQATTKYTLESTDKFILTDKSSQTFITCTGIQEHLLADGRLEVVANIKNQERTPVQIQISCVFKDDALVDTGDEPVWQALDLVGNTTEAIRFTANNTQGKKYTIRVRQAR